MTSNFPYKKVLVLGATSGIGKALASKFVANGIAVVAVGRRREYLDEFVQQHGADMASAKVFDITQLDKVCVPPTAQLIMTVQDDSKLLTHLHDLV